MGTEKGKHSELAALNKWFTKRFIPESPKMARTTLVPKGQTPTLTDMDHWRPITICSVFYRLFTRMLAARILRLDQSIFSECWRGFVMLYGCLLSIKEMCRIMAYQKVRAGLWLDLFVDFRKAFDLLSHKSLINEVAKQLGMEASKLVTCIYTNASTSFKGGGNLYLTNGVRQGCPLSPFLFNFAMNPLLQEIEESTVLSFDTTYGTVSRSVLAYADDLVLFAVTPKDLSNLVTVLSCWCANFVVAMNTSSAASSPLVVYRVGESLAM